MLDRRSILAVAGSSAVLSLLSAPARASHGPTVSPESERLTAILEQVYEDLLDVDVEFCTSMGLDKGARREAKSRLNDRSPAGLRRQHAVFRDGLTALRSIDPSRLSGMDLINYETFREPWETFVAAYDTFSYGLHSWPEPHPVTQLSGIYRSVPDFLVNQHTLATEEDAEAWLARCDAFAVELDHETDRLKADHAAGIIPPDFVLARTLNLYARVTAPTPEANVLTTHLAAATAAGAITGDWATRCATLVRDRIYPAMQRQMAELRNAQSRATPDAGVWRLPNGDEYYAYALRYATTTGMAPEEVHALGLEMMADLTGRADVILKSQGLTQGSVADRLSGLAKDPRFVYPNTDEGKAALIGDLNAQIVEMQRRLPEMFRRMPRARVEVRRVPPEIEAGATGGYYQPPAQDGSRPGAYYINLRDTAETPRWAMPTLTYHEATPGHHHQIALALEATGVPRLRRLPAYSVYTEGWALYAEQLADEMGVYDNDPFGRIGYLQSYMFRAARLVVDTGLHHMRWSRERAIQYMSEALGMADASTITEVERYCVWPGQATSYMVGQSRWVAVRDGAQARLGERFDLRDFHDMALAAGAVPMSVLESIVERWIADQGG